MLWTRTLQLQRRRDDRSGDRLQVLLPRTLEGRQLRLHYGHGEVQGTMNLHMTSTVPHLTINSFCPLLVVLITYAIL